MEYILRDDDNKVDYDERDGDGAHISSWRTVVVGSRFGGRRLEDVPDWFQTLAQDNAILDINGTLYFFTGNECWWSLHRAS